MPLPNILKKASNYILGGGSELKNPPFNEGEVVFCKNNVCVHPPALLRQACDVVHHPGYLSVSCQLSGPQHKIRTLHLSWIPNSTLHKHPGAIQRHNYRDERSDSLSSNDVTLPCGKESCLKCLAEDRLHDANYRTTYREFRRRSSGGESWESTPKSGPPSLATSEPPSSNSLRERNLESTAATSISDESTSLATQEGESNFPEEAADKLHVNLPPTPSPTHAVNGSNSSTDAPSKAGVLSLQPGPKGEDFLVSIVEPEDNTSPQECESLRQRSPSTASTCSFLHPSCPPSFQTSDDMPAWLSSPELLALRHNLTFPESVTASPVVRRTHNCRRFSVDLGQMRSLRLFFNDIECTSGQLVVASQESQYKILHFHHGGLDHLAAVLNEWSFLLHSPQQTGIQDTLPYRHFMICRPEVGEDELHPEEGQIGVVDLDVWIQVLNPEGQIEDDLTLRKGIFFGGLEPSLRSVVWPFLLHCYPFQSTYDEREQVQALRRQEYLSILEKRESLTGEEYDEFFRNVQCIVEKDVIRTDRANPYFAGSDNPNIDVMKNILLNYAIYNKGAGYTQGMSDLLAPVLVEMKNEADAFWCFVGLMQRASFVCTPTDGDMDRSLTYLRELIRVMLPSFFNHLERHTDAMELLFCHRWILLCFKREFPEPLALAMWEACWANYITDYFHLFLCLSILSVYADDVIAQDLHTDEMLLHFSSLAMFMDGHLILRKARGLLHQFRQMPCIPCTLAGLCQMCGPGMWDSSHAPVVECNGTSCLSSPCPYSAAPDKANSADD
ncbi:TBC1 domain family member 16 [Thrips palmi]|uniref:TBC1 domain family member 16 n=1 Tax=Thrips palmi TaxID=161013 RepID=A0A6P8Z7C5_THRPL|nr:TBC1 domain family member 16 [Thrips palmi]